MKERFRKKILPIIYISFDNVLTLHDLENFDKHKNGIQVNFLKVTNIFIIYYLSFRSCRIRIFLTDLMWLTILAQSICTHYSRFENMGWFATLKKNGSKVWGAKSRVQK